ncbi:MAG: hypothetical protein ACT4ON_03130 [Bacteroidota bacterium]
MKKIPLLLLSVLFTSIIFSQEKMNTRKWRTTEIDSLTKAQLFYEEGNYLLAYPIFNQMAENHPKELYLKYSTGMCGLYRSDAHAKAMDYLSQVYEKNKKTTNIEYDLARAYHYNYKFDEALILLEKYFKNKKLEEPQKKKAQQLMEYCNNAKSLVASPVNAKITNVGNNVNTANAEYVPIISSDESVMIFTYRGNESTGGLQNAFNQPDKYGIYYEDVFVSYKENNNWTKPVSLGPVINTNTNDAAIALSNDGQKLFIFKGLDAGDIYISKLDSTNWSEPEKLSGQINTTSWEGSASLSSDEKTIYFSSERPEGSGGKDIYKATLQADNTWGNIQNLGTTINTASDEDAPFIHPDGKTLIFSSRGLNSMGGYDIFISDLNPDTTWTSPKNIGYPINTPDEDTYFVLSADGNRGYYSSGKEGGYGLQDIYMVDLPDDLKKPVLAMVKGVVKLDSNGVEATIEVSRSDKKTMYGTYQSNAVHGNYLVNLLPGSSYQITYKLKGFPDQVQTLDITNINKYLEKVIDIKFVTIKDTVRTDSLLAKADTAKRTISDAVNKYGNSSKDGLEFKVQIAAFKFSNKYKYEKLKGLGSVEKLVLEDGITRFTIGGSFKTLNEAIAHKKKIKAAGQADAFVTAIYQGKRLYLPELEKLGLIQLDSKK